MFAATNVMPRASGIYGIFQLDDRPLDTRGSQALGLPTGAGEGAAWTIAGHDPFMPDAVSRYDEGGAITLLVGFIEDAPDLARRLGLDATSSPARLARAALKRFGSDAPTEVIGEWSLLHRASDGTLTLMVSAGVRDPIFYAVSGRRVAVAPDLFALARIDWVDRGIDEAGLLFPVARAALRAARGETTMLRGARQIGSGASVVIDPHGGVSLRQADILVPQPRLAITFDELVEETERLLRRILAARLERTERCAHMLSGGIDSSLLAWLAAEERASGQRPIAVSSAAPPDSGLPDETAYADIVAGKIGTTCHSVWPAEDANIYRPRRAVLTGQNGPPFSNRHVLTDALVTRAMAEGATAMIDGTYGEMTATVRLPQQGMTRRLRASLGRLVRGGHAGGEDAALSPFHVRLASHRMASLPAVMAASLAAPVPPWVMPGTDEVFGYIPGIDRGLSLPTEYYPGGLRTEFPFRDMRLLRLFAGVPVRTILDGGADRSVARRMMDGHLPDSIRLRRRGMPASPDHNSRLQHQAAAARDRIALFRKASVDDWVDIDWLDQALTGMAISGPRDVTHGNEVQLTAIMAEFLLWWSDQGYGTTP